MNAFNIYCVHYVTYGKTIAVRSVTGIGSATVVGRNDALSFVYSLSITIVVGYRRAY